MTIFDILGPVMVGPSSSHTAGAVRIGLLARRLLGGDPIGAELILHGSFAATGRGHGTDRALIAGLLGMAPDDPRIPQSFALANGAGLSFHFQNGVLKDAHPNSVRIKAMRADGGRIDLTAASLGGGRVRVMALDGMPAGFSGEKHTLIIRHRDQVGQVAIATRILSGDRVNIASMQLYRSARGGEAIMIIESDEAIASSTLRAIRGTEGVLQVTYLNAGGEE